jgi:hypothetical protein
VHVDAAPLELLEPRRLAAGAAVVINRGIAEAAIRRCE